MAAPTVSESKQNLAPEEGTPTHHLLVLAPEYTASHQLPATGMLLIGREEDADVRVVDPLASRHHARLHLGAVIELEDLGSANGTLLRERPLEPNHRSVIGIGETITIGSTILVVQRREPTLRTRRVWPHGYFEARLIEECARAESVRGTFAMARLHIEGAAADRAEELIARTLRPGDVLGAYGPNEYEILLVDTGRRQMEAIVGQIIAALAEETIAVRVGQAFFPADGGSPQALVSRACGGVRGQEGSTSPPQVILQNEAMRQLYEVAGKVAVGTINVLVLGETGVGKELLAKAVHTLSPRSKQPFVCVNCAALSESLLESELFGHEKGAFTGAVQAKAGLLEAASGGTVFLDEVGEMSEGMQAKLLRAIETRQVTRVGATKPRAVDVRFVAATNRDLDEEVAAKRFRGDLYFRLNGMALSIPPLRERADEIEPMARKFLEDAAGELGRPPPPISPAAMALLRSYTWPGNIRELRNTMERALLLSTAGEIAPEHLPLDKMQKVSAAWVDPPVEATTPAAGGTLRDLERQAILDALARCAGNQTRAAELLGMPRRTFCTRLTEYKILRPKV